MSDRKPTAWTLITEVALDILETAIGLSLFVVAPVAFMALIAALAAKVLGVPSETLRITVARLVDAYGDYLLAGLGLLFGTGVLFAVLKAVWKRWPIFE